MQWCTTEFSAISFMSTAPEGFGRVHLLCFLERTASGIIWRKVAICARLRSVYSILVAQLTVQMAAQLVRPGTVVKRLSGTVLKTDHERFLKTDHIHHTHSTHSPHTHSVFFCLSFFSSFYLIFSFFFLFHSCFLFARM